MTTGALVRPVPDSVTLGLSLDPNREPVSLSVARQEHDVYEQVLRDILGKDNVFHLPVAHNLPDSQFVEDPVVVANGKVILNFMGAPSRRCEVDAFRHFFQAHSIFSKQYQCFDMHTMDPLASMDGGDVLFVSEWNMFFVGQSSRTNQQGVNLLQSIHADSRVVHVKVDKGLHLKSFVAKMGSTLDGKVHLVCSACDIGMDLVAQMKAHLQSKDTAQIHYVPNTQAANCVTIKVANVNHVLIKSGFPESEKVYHNVAEQEQYCNQFVLHAISFSEVEKIDGALTCCSVLI